MKEIIRLENVTYMTSGSYRAVNGVSFTVNEEECIGIQGPLGCGKTTLMRLIAGMELPSSGAIYVMGKGLPSMSCNAAADFRNRHCGCLQSNPGFLPYLNVMENIALPLAVRSVPSVVRRKKAKDILKELDLYPVANARPMQLSRYEAVVASIGRAFITEPEILLVDELFLGLSLKETERVTKILNDIHKRRKRTTICFYSSQDSPLNISRNLEMNKGMVWEG